MAPEYKIRLYTPAGVLVSEFSDPAYLSYTKQVNAAGNLRFQLNASHTAAQYLVDKAQVQVWRQNLRIGVDALGNAITMPWQVDFYGLVRDSDEKQLKDGTDVIVVDCPGPLHMLSWRQILWAAGTTDRSTFTSTAAESIMKLLVKHNITSFATVANGRKQDGTLTGPVTISIQADGAGGNVLGTWSCAWDNLLEELQALAKVAGGDFDLVQTTASNYEFRWYTTTRGTDRRTGAGKLTFSTAAGNIANPRLQRLRSKVRTSALVAGADSGSARATTARTGNGYVLGTNNIEMFVDARNLDAGASLNAEGDNRLAENRLKEVFTFDVLQTPASYYGKHFQLADLVNVQYKTYTATHKITKVAVAWGADSGESIDIETEVYA